MVIIEIEFLVYLFFWQVHHWIIIVTFFTFRIQRVDKYCNWPKNGASLIKVQPFKGKKVAFRKLSVCLSLVKRSHVRLEIHKISSCRSCVVPEFFWYESVHQNSPKHKFWDSRRWPQQFFFFNLYYYNTRWYKFYCYTRSEKRAGKSYSNIYEE